MQQRAAKVDKSHIEFRTSMAKDAVKAAIERGEKMRGDPDKVKRKAAQKCIRCYYDSARIGGAAMTERACGICDEPQTYGSTATDELCQACADRNLLCKQCGGDVDMKRRQDRPDI